MYQPLHNSNAFEGFGSESSDVPYILKAGFCMDPDIEVDELRHKLVTLNVQLKRIDRELDYSRIIRTLGDVPPSQALLDRMRRQVDRMQRDLEQLQTPTGALDRLQAPPTSEVLNFLQVPRARRTRIVEAVTTESVKALYSLHQIRYQAFRLNMRKTSARNGKMTTGRTAAANRHGAFDTDDPSSSCSGKMSSTSSRKRRGRADDDYGEKRRRWKKMASEARRRSKGRTVATNF